MGLWDYDPYEVNGVHYASLETYERAKKRAERSSARRATDDWYRGHMEEKRAAKREQDSREKSEAADRRARLQADRQEHELTVEQGKTRREELRLERTRIEAEQKETARREKERSARERANLEEARRAAQERAQEILDRGAEDWRHPARLDLLDPRTVPDPEGASRAEAGPEPLLPQDTSLGSYSVADAWLRAGWGLEGRPGPGFAVYLARPQSWWPALACETETRPEADVMADRDRLARERLRDEGVDAGWERSLFPRKKAAWRDSYARAFWEADVPADRPCRQAQADNDLVRRCLDAAASSTADSLLVVMKAVAASARSAAAGIRTEASQRQEHNRRSAEVFEEIASAYPGKRAAWESDRSGILEGLSSLVALYDAGDPEGTVSYLASAATWSLEPYLAGPGLPPVAVTWDPQGRTATIDVVLPDLVPPPCTARFASPAAERLELVAGSATRQQEMVVSALAELPVRVAVELLGKDYRGCLDGLTVNVWDRGISVGDEVRGVACCSTLTAGRDLAEAYDGNAAGFLRAANSRSGKAGSIVLERTSVAGGTLVPTPALPLWSRED